MTFFDFRAGSHTVYHNILVTSLKSEYGVGGIDFNWFKSYLSNRGYKVKVNTTLSDAHLGLVGTH